MTSPGEKHPCGMCQRHAEFWESASIELTEEEAAVWEVMDR